MPEETALAPIETENYLAFDDSFDIAEIVEDTFTANETMSRRALPSIPFSAAGSTVWETVDGAVDVISGVVLHMHGERRFYERPFEETGGKEPALCRSSDGLTGIGDPGGACASCAMAQWTEQADGSRTKPRCSERSAIYILRPGEVLPTRISVPPTSLSDWGTFRVQHLLNKRLTLKGVELELRLRREENDNGRFSVLVPSVAAVLSPEQKKTVREYGEGVLPLILDDAKKAAEEDATA